MSVSGNLVLAIKMLLESGQFKAELNQAVASTQDAASKIEGSTKGLGDAVQQAVKGQSAVVRGAVGALTALGPIAGAAVVGAAAVGLAYHQAGQETLAYEKAIILTGNAAGVTSGQMADMARRIDGVAGTQANAAAALATMTASGKIASGSLEKVSLAAVEMERATGQSIGEAEKIFSSLGKDPVAASLRLNESMNYLTASTYAQIKAAQDLGDKEGAASIAQDAAADALRSRAAQVEKHLGYVERAWRSAGDAAKWAWDRFADIGRADTLASSLDRARSELEQKLNTPLAVDNPAMRASRDKGIERLRQEISLLSEQERLLKKGAAAQAERNQVQTAGVAAAKALNEANERAMSRQERAAKELDAYRDNVKELQAAYEQSPSDALAKLLDPETIKKAEAAIVKSGQERTRASNTAQKELEREAALLANLSGVNADYQEQLTRLQKVREKGNISEERYIELVNQLIAKQPMAKKFMDEQAASTKAAEKATVEATKAREKTLATAEKELEKLSASVVAQEEQNARLGLSKEAIAELDAAKLEMLATDTELLAANALFLNQNGELFLVLQKQAKAYRDLAQAKRDGAAKQVDIDREKQIEDVAGKAAKEGEKAAERIEQSLTDSLMRGFEAGKDMARNLRDTVVNMFKTMVLRPMVSAIVSPVAGAITGAMGLASAGQSVGGSAGGASNLLSAASLAGNSSFMMGLSGAWGSGGGMLSTLNAGASMLGQASSFMSGMGTIAGALGPIAIGIALLSSLIKKSTPHTGGIGAYSAASGATTGSSVGLAFGIDQKHYTQAGEDLSTNVAKSIVGILDATATTFGKQAGYYAATAFADDSSKDGAWGALRIKFGEKVLLDWADTAVRDANVPREFADGEAGQKQYLAAVAASARDALVQAIGDVDWATDMLTALGESPTLESLAQTVQQINAAQAAFDALGKNIVGFGALTDGAISQLIKAAGSIDGLVSAASAYYDNFYSEAEKTANVTRDVAAALADVGLQMPTTREEFRALVESQMALGDAGTDAVAALLGVSGAFASVTAASETAADAAARLADEQAKAAKEAQDAYQKQAQAAQDAADAARRAQEELLEALTKAAEQALEILGNAIDAEKKEQQAGYDAQMVIIDAQRKASTTFVEAQRAWLGVAIGGAQNYAKVMESEAARIRGFFTGMVLQDDPDAPAGASVFSAQAALRAGDKSDAVLRKATDIDPEMFASWADYAVNFFETQGLVGGVLQGAERAASVAASDVALLEQQLTLAEEKYKEDLEHYTRLEGIAKDTLDANILRLDGILQAAQDQLAEALGTKLAVMGLGAALGNFAGAVARLSDVTKNPVTTPLSTTAPVLTTYGTADRAEALVAQVTAYNPVISGATSSSTNNQVVDVLREVVAELQALRTTGADTRAAVEKTTALLDQVTGGGNAMLTETA